MYLPEIFLNVAELLLTRQAGSFSAWRVLWEKKATKNVSVITDNVLTAVNFQQVTVLSENSVPSHYQLPNIVRKPNYEPYFPLFIIWCH